MSLPALLLHTVALHRKAATRDSSGGAVEGYAVVTGYSAIPCLVQSKSGKASRQLGERQVVGTHYLYFDQDPGWRRGDRFYWASGAAYFSVHNVSDMGGQGRVWRADCTQVEV